MIVWTARVNRRGWDVLRLLVGVIEHGRLPIMTRKRIGPRAGVMPARRLP